MTFTFKKYTMEILYDELIQLANLLDIGDRGYAIDGINHTFNRFPREDNKLSENLHKDTSIDIGNWVLSIHLDLHPDDKKVKVKGNKFYQTGDVGVIEKRLIEKIIADKKHIVFGNSAYLDSRGILKQIPANYDSYFFLKNPVELYRESAGSVLLYGTQIIMMQREFDKSIDHITEQILTEVRK